MPQGPLGSPIFPSGCEGKLGVALESLQGRRDLILSGDGGERAGGEAASNIPNVSQAEPGSLQGLFS